MNLMIIIFIYQSILLIVDSQHIECPVSQSIDSHSVCHVFKNTNIEEVIPQNFNDTNYCEWGYRLTLIGCAGDDDEHIDIIELQYQQGLNGTLDFTQSWPEKLIELDLEQSASSSTNLYGEWNWQSLVILEDLMELDLEGNQV